MKKCITVAPDSDWEAKTKGKTERLVAVHAPRPGRAQAPEAIMPKGTMTQAEVRERFLKLRAECSRRAGGKRQQLTRIPKCAESIVLACQKYELSVQLDQRSSIAVFPPAPLLHPGGFNGATTNVIESPHAGVRMRTDRVSHWKNAAMVQRWGASAFLATERSFRRIMGYKDLWALKAILDAKVEKDIALKKRVA